MGKKDSTQKRLEDYNDVFADIINVLIFDGKEVVKENELETTHAKDTYTAEEQEIHEIERDVAKKWRNADMHIAMLGLENQTATDDDMPLRVICYDGASYRSQLNKDQPTKHFPVITLVLYMGTEKKWEKPLTLTDCFNVDNKLADFISDYKINVINLAWLEEEKIQKFKSDFKNFVEYLRDTRLGREPRYSRIKLKHIHDFFQLMRAMTGDNNYKIMYEEFVKAKHKGVEPTMESILTLQIKRSEAKGEARGKAEGRAEGKAEGRAEQAKNTALAMYKDKINIETIAKYTKFDISTIKEWIKEANSNIGKSLI